MQADLLPFIDWNHYPRQIISPQDRIITAGDPTDVLFLLEYGVALAPNAALHNQIQPNDTAKLSTDNEMIYRTGALLSLLEMLSLDIYRHDVLAYEKCWVVGIHRNDIKAMWDRDSQLAWPLSRSLAASITQRRQIQFLM